MKQVKTAQTKYTHTLTNRSVRKKASFLLTFVKKADYVKIYIKRDSLSESFLISQKIKPLTKFIRFSILRK